MIIWLNPFSGISGDMLLGALLDLGAPIAAVRAAIAATGMTGWELTAVPVTRAGLAACQARVEVAEHVPERRAAELLAMAGAARPEPVARVATAAIAALARAESRIHGIRLDQVHLHELGGVDTIADVVGVAAAIHALQVTGVWSAPVALGSGGAAMAHGRYPLPAPATVALLEGAQVTGAGLTELDGETATPTGAALLRALDCQYGALPAARIVATGYGAGSRDTSGRPNVLPALLCEPVPDPAAGPGPGSEQTLSEQTLSEQTLLVLETNVDDVTGELLGALPGLLLADGALDAWLTPVIGKKGRPGHVISALCSAAAADAVESRLLRETGSLGARRYDVRRRGLPRSGSGVVVAGHLVRIKVGPHRAKPEHEDVAAAARATGLPQRVIAERAISEYLRQASPADGGGSG
jgi:pyridinium-3,5-bisthiocarboxylic acid mononucleotide nickel chelatase